jgi:hypothetical protein
MSRIVYFPYNLICKVYNLSNIFLNVIIEIFLIKIPRVIFSLYILYINTIYEKLYYYNTLI